MVKHVMLETTELRLENGSIKTLHKGQAYILRGHAAALVKAKKAKVVGDAKSAKRPAAKSKSRK